MYGDNYAFFGIVRTRLVRGGEDVILPKRQHTAPTVYTEMLLQVTRDYPGLPDVRTLKASEIRFFYEGLRAELKQSTRG